MQYYILKKQKMFGKVEYETEMKARRGYENIADAIQKKVALETLNEHDGVEYIIVNDGTPTEQVIESMEHDQERANHIAKSVNRGEL
jgi:hypothetical protein